MTRRLTEEPFFEDTGDDDFFNFAYNVTVEPSGVPLETVYFLQKESKGPQDISAVKEGLTPEQYFGKERWETEIYLMIRGKFERKHPRRRKDTPELTQERLGNFFYKNEKLRVQLEALATPESHLIDPVRAQSLLTAGKIRYMLGEDVIIHRPELFFPGLNEKFTTKYLEERGFTVTLTAPPDEQ